ncbi:replication initiation protein RepC [Kiloniella sp. b19]|uniref:replication initiation protein RepC n=1 Tax=Kiloniella sp. GXU_MW_B19 TaxID=3141326 RepID=UPI0031D83FB3
MGLITRFGSGLGLTSALKDHLLWLIGSTKAQDWTQEAPFGPVVYVSVMQTAKRFNLSERAIWYREQQLIELGLISLKTTNDNKRFGKRDQFDHLSVAFGVDLSPLLNRYVELVNLQEESELRDRAWQKARNDLSAIKKMVRVGLEKILELGANVARVQDLYGVYYSIPRISAQTAIDVIRSYIENMKLVMLEVGKIREDLQGKSSEQTGDMSDASEKDFRPYTNLQNKGKFLSESNADCGLMSSSIEDEEGGHMRADARTAQGSAKEPVCPVEAGQGKKTSVNAAGDVEKVSSGIENCSLEIARLAASEDFIFEVEYQEQDDLIDVRSGNWDWYNLRRAAGKIRKDLFISDGTWKRVGQVMTPNEMAVAMLVIDQKKFWIQSPGGYLWEMAARHARGELRLDKTLFGLADRERLIEEGLS